MSNINKHFGMKILSPKVTNIKSLSLLEGNHIDELSPFQSETGLNVIHEQSLRNIKNNARD